MTLKKFLDDDDISSFEQLLEQDNSFTIHHLNIQTMAIEMYKIKHCLSANCFNNIFVNIDDDMYNLRSGCDFRVPSVNTENCGKNSLRYFGPVIWNMIPLRVRNIETLTEFKKEIR